MPDQNFHEIQLSGKQLVFLFMCAVVLAGVIFIFGVSVGRGVRSASGQNAQADVSTDTNVPAEPAPAAAPAATAPANPNELSYAQALQGRGPDPGTVVPPTPPAEEPPAAAKPKAAEPPATTPAKPAASTPQPVAAPVQKPAAPTPAPKPAASGDYTVQVEAFGANDVAAREVAKLKRLGHQAFVFTAPDGTPGPRFKVQVGPFKTRAEADRAIKTLRTQGYRPLIKR